MEGDTNILDHAKAYQIKYNKNLEKENKQFKIKLNKIEEKLKQDIKNIEEVRSYSKTNQTDDSYLKIVYIKKLLKELEV